MIIREVDKRNEWEAFLAQHEEANFLQSWYWGEFHQKLGHAIVRLGCYRGEKLVGLMLAIVEDAKRGRYLTIPAGPILDWHDTELVDALFSEMSRVGKAMQCAFVRIRPQLVDDNFSRQLFKSHQFIDAPMYLHAELTSQIDVTKSEEELLSGMRKTTRYEIKKAQKIGVKITANADESLIKSFYALQLETAKRQKFVPFAYRYFWEQFTLFFAEDKALLYTATFEDMLLAQAFIIFYGKEAVYHYAVSTEEGRKYPGAYLLQWEVMKEAKRRGMKRYNLWGVAPVGVEHRFANISVFKRGFGGEDIAYLHAQDLVIDRPRYAFNLVVEKVRKVVRKV